MTLGIVLIYIGIAALILTVATYLVFHQRENLLVSLLQNFCGTLFIFSGWVKAVDPLGTAYKMEQYFAEFQATFSDTAVSFLAPLFPWLSNYVNTFSVVMIVLEIILGLALILGAHRKLTAWVFFLIVAFFTFLTGFTYLTGYVPEGVNFFQFGQWGDYVETNMKVTDCGCFGDFIKLEPKTSFLKDVFLLIPALLFLFKSGSMHQLFNPGTRSAVLGIATIGLIVYSFSNYVWDIPHADFRPFKEGVNIYNQKMREAEAQQNVEILAYRMTNKETGKVVEIPYDQYLKEYKKYPKEEWELEQVKSEPEVEPTKISDFDISNLNGVNVNEKILTIPGPAYMVVAYDLKATTSYETISVKDTTYQVDTVSVGDSTAMVRSVDAITDREVQVERYSWPEDYLTKWSERVVSVLKAAKENDDAVYILTKYGSPEMFEAFSDAIGLDVPIYVGDDILLKTIVRSNPGIVLLQDGTITKKWHYRKLPEFDQIKQKYYQ